MPWLVKVGIYPVGRRRQIILGHGYTRGIVDYHLHVLVAEGLDLLDHVRVGITALAITNPLELAHHVGIMLALDPRIVFFRDTFAVLTMTFHAVLLVQLFTLREFRRPLLPLTPAILGVHGQLLDIGHHVRQ